MRTILIVEDQQDVQALLGVALRHPERRLLNALNAEQGLALARSEHPDLILLDIMMPGGMDGLAMLRTLRADPGGGDVKVIIMSARTQQKDIAAAFAAGADDYLPKPFRLKELQETVARYWARLISSVPQGPRQLEQPRVEGFAAGGDGLVRGWSGSAGRRPGRSSSPLPPGAGPPPPRRRSGRPGSGRRSKANRRAGSGPAP